MSKDLIEVEFEIVPGGTSKVVVDYLPYGTKTLKIRSFVRQGTQPPLRLWPGKPDYKLERKDLFVCHEDGGDDLWITWGAGHEQGPWARSGGAPGDDGLQLSPDTTGFSYLNVIHPNPEKRRSGSPLPLRDYELTVHAMTESRTPISSLEITLTVPRVYKERNETAELTNPVCAQWEAVNDNTSIIRFKGTEVPLYVSRWWATHKIRYQPLQPRSAQLLAINGLRIEYERTIKAGKHWWDDLWETVGGKLTGERGRIRVFLESKQDALMEIGGNLETNLFDEQLFLAEVFRFFDQRHIVLRLWFLWVDKSRHMLHEVPDAERFDLLIDAENGNLSFVGTDLHWQEMWFQRRRHPVRANIGLTFSKIMELAREWLEETSERILQMGRRAVRTRRGNPVVNLLDILKFASETGTEQPEKGAGPFSHVPSFDPDTLGFPELFETELISGDVREV